jgi:hypothetical protein
MKSDDIATNDAVYHIIGRMVKLIDKAANPAGMHRNSNYISYLKCGCCFLLDITQ